MRKQWRFLPLLTSVLLTGCAGMMVVVDDRPADPRPEVRGRPPVPAGPMHLGVPPGHLPPPGHCRIWFPGRPPGHQPPPGRCARLEHQVPAGAWLLYRPAREHVRVSVCDAKRPGVIVAVRLYEAESGRFLR
jgi:hypothetical protein